MRPVLALALLSLSTLAVACGSTTLTRTGAVQPARPENCAFEVVTSFPKGPYTEVGTIDIQPGQLGRNVYRTLGGVEEEIAPEVCKAGGDVAVAQANAYGRYDKAIVLKRGAQASTTTLTSASLDPKK